MVWAGVAKWGGWGRGFVSNHEEERERERIEDGRDESGSHLPSGRHVST